MKSGIKSNIRVQVTLRFVGDNVDSEVITSKIGLQPSRSHLKGELVTAYPGRVYPTGLWSFDSTISHHSSFEDHLINLLDVMESKASVIQELKGLGMQPNFYCGYFVGQETIESYIKLGIDTLERMARIGVSLDLHIYYVED